jgi:serine/threonine protein phosphatase PrpC
MESDATLQWALEIGYRSDPGRQRGLNEDSYLVLAPPAVAAGIDALLVVADGMGGHQAGEVASGLVVTTLDRWFTSDEYRQHVAYSPQHDDYFVAVLKELLERLNTQVYDLAARQSHLSGMGTTATVALLQGDHLFLGHVGDSRAYLLRQDQFYQMSQDHTWVEEQVQNGHMSPEEAAHHPRRHVLTRALGHRPIVRPDRQQHSLQPGDTLLLCSDGLSGVVPDETLRQVLLNTSGAQVACDQLVSLANQGGGPDNITVVVARLLQRAQDGIRPDQHPVPVEGLAGGRGIGPQDRYRSVGARVSDTLRLRRRRLRTSAPDARTLRLLTRGTLLILGSLSAFVAGWAVHSSLVPDSISPQWASASVAALSFLIGVLVGRGLRSR